MARTKICRAQRLLLIAVIALLTGCLAQPGIRPQRGELRQQQTRHIEQAVLDVARTGDWLVIRGYHASDTLVANATGLPLSHVAVFNADSREVIEAEGKGVHRSTLVSFVDRAHRVLVIRPRWRSEANAGPAWDQAVALVGKGYDFLGVAGFNYPDKYYCSELVITIYRPWFSGRERFPVVIKPGEMYLYGTVLYDSLDRDERDDG